MRSVNVFNAHAKHRIRRSETIKLARCVLKGEGCARAELNIVFINDDQMRVLNGKYLKHRYPTDVLSFSLGETGKRNLDGEVYVNLDQARRQAREYHVSRTLEIRRLIAHGLLHLLGYDDGTKRQRQEMTRKEDFYLREFMAGRA